jgi:hypothetical protein
MPMGWRVVNIHGHIGKLPKPPFSQKRSFVAHAMHVINFGQNGHAFWRGLNRLPFHDIPSIWRYRLKHTVACYMTYCKRKNAAGNRSSTGGSCRAVIRGGNPDDQAARMGMVAPRRRNA